MAKVPPFHLQTPEDSKKEAQESFDAMERITWPEWACIALGGVAVLYIVWWGIDRIFS